MSDLDKAQRREIQEKLNKQYIDTKINPIVEPMALALFTSAEGSKDPVSCVSHRASATWLDIAY